MELEAERARELVRIAALEAELAALDSHSSIVHEPQPIAEGARRSPAAKLEIFRGLFRGRTDVYPTRFESKKGKAGYAPACNNKFVPGKCELPKVKCGECKNQAFFPVDDAALLDHLRGQHVMGVYPMLLDGTCWFLAVDFDKTSWMDDVRAFSATCRRLKLPVAVERSRSGDGAHAWFFFTSPVAASAARKLGCYVLTETMAERHELGMDSYDRLFPSQDNVPEGGFGNLIALPLQLRSREHGNTEFLDEQLVPLPGDQQWDLLDSIGRIDPATVERIAAEASKGGRILGVRAGENDEDVALLELSPRGKHSRERILGPLPERVSAVLAQRLAIETTGLSSPLINLLKRTAAFENPEFHKKQAMRLSTATTRA